MTTRKWSGSEFINNVIEQHKQTCVCVRVCVCVTRGRDAIKLCFKHRGPGRLGLTPKSTGPAPGVPQPVEAPQDSASLLILLGLQTLQQ